ncbi:MAG TPA: non-canonical purine NTP pyrophosphatase [bacterium]|nr:non-canonical purine NTP pyrophosphatase [bacterium]HPV65068.1 non-canonical purine NTP pyrophosphatase [bacterium]
MKILIATHNPGKLKRYQNLFADFTDLELVSLKDLNISTKIDEPHNSPEENSIFKAKEYGKISLLPTIAIDEALSTNFLPENEQPGVFVRRFNKEKRELNDLEVIEIWKRISQLYPGKNRRFVWDFRMSYFDVRSNFLKTAKSIQNDFLADEFSNKINPGYPMSSFLIPEGYNKTYVELGSKDLLKIDKNNLAPFSTLLKSILVKQ